MSLRIPIMFGLPTEKCSPADLLILPGVVQAELISGNLWRIVVGESSYAARLVKSSFRAKGMSPFCLWMMIQNHAADYRPGTKMMRFLKRAQSGPDAKDLFLGPWSAKELAELEVLERDEVSVFGEPGQNPSVPWVMMGESPEDCFQLDYRPSEKEFMDDSELPEVQFMEMKRATL